MLAAAANGVKSFQGKPKGVDTLMAVVTARVGAVPFRELAYGEILGGFILGQARHVLGRLRELITEKRFGHPVAAQDRSGARSARLFGQRRLLAENPAPGKSF